ncbi:hypothetical protein [Limosilactobacillus coleohominis]|uniref:hypothetical protein n=1 Tax=Limosilactobacillus coleohominis TaxID=181675 RepID=UPI00195DC4EF|nr:hypothetical protein [Limosilactobacillus coleohominis]
MQLAKYPSSPSMSGMPGFREPNAAFEKYAEESDTVHLTRQIIATLDHPLTIEIKGLTAGDPEYRIVMDCGYSRSYYYSDIKPRAIREFADF